MHQIALEVAWATYFGAHLLLLVVLVDRDGKGPSSVAEVLSSSLLLGSIFNLVILLAPERRRPADQRGLAVLPEMFMFLMFGCNAIGFFLIRCFAVALNHHQFFHEYEADR